MINFESITSLNSYVRTNEMTRKWSEKKRTAKDALELYKRRDESKKLFRGDKS